MLEAERVGRPPYILAIFLILLGGTVAVLGAWLAVLGGSPYYVLNGILVTAAGILVWRRSAFGAWLYAGFLAITIAWSIAEAGLDAWALVPRLFGVSVVGLVFLAPWYRRALGTRPTLATAGLGGIGLALIVASAALTGGGDAGVLPPTSQAVASSNEWLAYGATEAGDRFSSLTQINRNNVSGLKPAWTYHTGIIPKGIWGPLEVTPIMVDDTLYMCTQTDVVIAVDPDTGTEKWRFDPKINPEGATGVTACRGVAFARVPQAPDCQARIISATFDARLIALDAKTGRPCQSFGQGGIVDLKQGMGAIEAGFYYVSSAPTIARGRIVLGGWIADNMHVGEPSGVVRAFDVATGKFAWAWDLGRPGFNGQPGPGETYTRGTPNSWAPMSADDALGLVYVPTGNATPDHWGAERSALSEKYASSVVAIDASNGTPRWSFQATHHDLWDYDVGSQPTLVNINVRGRSVPALVQPTKTGQIYLLDRRDGTFLSNVSERPVPQGPAAGDRLSATQPYSDGLPSFTGGQLSEKDMWGISPIDQVLCRIQFRSLRYEGDYTPPSTQGTLVWPGIGGGMNWGSAAVDPERGVLIVNANRIGTYIRLIPRAQAKNTHGMAHGYDALPASGTPFAVSAGTFMSLLGTPCQQPPYSTISAVDLNSHKLLWTHPLGTTADSGPFGTRMMLPIPMGVPAMGGSMITRSGLIFIAATQERVLRAIDIRTGEVVWTHRLPTAATTTPMTYRSSKTGKQYVVIVAGGSHLVASPISDVVQAFSLPD